ncbi:MAG TPA: D-alanyl-D-alanine carboxypeptidase family protein [Limnochordia bacterium]
MSMRSALVPSLAALCLLGGAAAARAAAPVALTSSSKAAILMDAASGRVLYAVNEHEALPPASVTKIMTLVLALEALERGEISLDELVVGSEYAASMGGTQIWLEPGEQLPMREILYAIAVGSANDAAVALAEHLAGSEAAFVEMMNARARELGMKNTQFANSTGLPPEAIGAPPTARHVMSAYDIALLSRHALSVPHFLEMVSTYGPVVMRPETKRQPELFNFNKMLRTYPGVDGIKTGMTSQAGYCLAATAKRDHLRLIAVSMGAPTAAERNRDVAAMLDWGFAQYRAIPIAEAAQTVGEAPVRKGTQETVKAVAARDLAITVPKRERVEPVAEVQWLPGLTAPIKKGERVGTLVVRMGEAEVGRVDLLAAADVGRASLWQLIARAAGRLFGGFATPQNAPPAASLLPAGLIRPTA